MTKVFFFFFFPKILCLKQEINKLGKLHQHPSKFHQMHSLSNVSRNDTHPLSSINVTDR